MSTAFGVRQTDAGAGFTVTDMRHILAAQWESTGVVSGLAVTGGTTLSYAVAAGVAVCSKGDSDGKTLAYFAGGSTATVAANSSGNPRIDCIWITSHDLDQGDADNLVTLGVTQGTPAATPTAPTIPTYATLLAQMVMPAGATTTANAHQAASIGYAIPYGASLGVLGQFSDLSSYTINSTAPVLRASLPISLATDRMVECTYARSVSTDAGGSLTVRMSVDGVPVRVAVLAANARWETHTMTALLQVGAGDHIISVSDCLRDGANLYCFGFRDTETTNFNGMTFQIIDRGVVR